MEDLELRISDFACLGIFTFVEMPLQINLFMQNKPNLVRRRRIANERKYIIQTAYKNKRDWTIGENKPNSNPIQTQSNPISVEQE